MTYYTYIATNSGKNVFYTGVTNNLFRRGFEHANKSVRGFTAKYNVNKVVWYETFDVPLDAITAENRIKGWSREKKIALIKAMNPRMKNLLDMETVEDPSPEGSG